MLGIGAAPEGSRTTLLPDWVEEASRGPLAKSRVGQLAFAPIGKMLAVLRTSPTGHAMAAFYRLGPRVEPKGNIEFPTTVNNLAWSPDATLLAAACEDHTVQLWSMETRHLVHTLAGHKRGVTAVAFSPDGRTLGSGDGRTIELWHVLTGRQMLTVSRETKLGEPLRWLAFAADGTRLLAADAGGRVQFFLAPLTSKAAAQ